MQLIIIFSCFAFLCDVESEAFVCVEGHLPVFPKEVKRNAYTTLVRPSVEYASAVWDSYTRNQINQLEQVQRRADRFVNNNALLCDVKSEAFVCVEGHLPGFSPYF
jgi:hypothetical protein